MVGSAAELGQSEHVSSQMMLQVVKEGSEAMGLYIFIQVSWALPLRYQSLPGSHLTFYTESVVSDSLQPHGL